jgi:hypothetical protein
MLRRCDGVHWLHRGGAIESAPTVHRCTLQVPFKPPLKCPEFPLSFRLNRSTLGTLPPLIEGAANDLL